VGLGLSSVPGRLSAACVFAWLVPDGAEKQSQEPPKAKIWSAAVRRRFGRQDVYRFSCSVNFATGVVRTAHIDQFPANSYR